jgi:hypothetical protein
MVALRSITSTPAVFTGHLVEPLADDIVFQPAQHAV